MKLAFIGLGKMGFPMARNLLLSGHQVTVYNRTREKAERLEADGAIVANSPAEACSSAEAAFSMLSDDKAAVELVLGVDGIAAGLPKNAVHLSASTISVGLVRRLTEEHARAGHDFLSTPVFGRPDAAAGRKLIVLVGGESPVADQMRPLLEALGRAVFFVGTEPWQANLLKLCGNFMIASMMGSFGEAFAAIRKGGGDQRTFFEVMDELFGSPVYKNYGGNIVDQKFEPAGFELKLGLKDIHQLLAATGEINSPMPIASVLRDLLISAMANNQGTLDWSSIARISARSAGLAG
jgi:3-hydroxyisobutyrate dehydrogenase-like beta-hydroxyacid dehydrogenase